ncbi:Retroviral aspartyl protease [Cucumis melo var. makuwa]|uniref:Retroviral aspartyl protease n=1 Tax=Cucumis melo var. makuwa TaxID=1194695 RepID=A0A5A7T2B5_CUCMM|nr:Retroviral aspartyl protease [Cucumis melo var. makuwa]TYK01985.1 Retroviral aspartyl protease [Cucumis melo var. makuwa]
MRESISSFHGMLMLFYHLRVTGAEVKTALCVEQGITEVKSAVELSCGASIGSGFKGREQQRFTPDCGQPGHLKKDCLQLNMTVQRDQGVGSQTVKQLRVSVVPIEGTSGARQKGVVGRPRQQGKLNRMLEPLPEGLATYTLVSDVLLVNEVLRNCEVLVEGISMLVDLRPLELQMLDVILGFDFLFAHYASMDCHRKEVVFRKLGFVEVVFRGMRKVVPRSLISVLKAEIVEERLHNIPCACSSSVKRQAEAKRCSCCNRVS